MSTATHRTRTATVEAVQFDGSMVVAEKLGLKLVKFSGATESVWWSPGIGQVVVGDWVSVVEGFTPFAIPENVFGLFFEDAAAPEPEHPRDLALRVAGDRIRELEHELQQMREQANAARAALRAANAPPPSPEPESESERATTVWYSCVVCSCKTNEWPASQMLHACCHGLARVGPCCAKAVQLSPGVVGSILDASCHFPECDRPR